MHKTVFFGPFIGEFHWEIACWQGWVRRICIEKFANFRKIACSYSGRAGLYPEVDEFISVPRTFDEEHKKHAVQYIIKGWRNGLPGSKEIRIVPKKEFKNGMPHVSYLEEEYFKIAPGPNVEPNAESMLKKIKEQLPKNTVYYVPWKYNKIASDKLEFGLLPAEHPKMKVYHPLPIEKRLLIEPITNDFQSAKFLTSIKIGRDELDKLIDRNKNLVSLFPRFRLNYRTRNWAKQKYLSLIEKLQTAFPDLQIAIIGEPGGAYFDNGVPPGTIDLINVTEKDRTAIQIAALEKSIFSFGSSSGGLNLAYYTGCPILKWSNPKDVATDISSQILSTPVKIIPTTHPEVEDVYSEILNFSHSLGNKI